MVMIAVLVGIMMQITQDGPLAPSSLFFFIVTAQLIITAFLHPIEIGCLPFGVVYYITVPSMYMLLIIYSLFNLNNVSWGTRENPNAQKSQEVRRSIIHIIRMYRKFNHFMTKKCIFWA
jgi:chitin synthase